MTQANFNLFASTITNTNPSKKTGLTHMYATKPLSLFKSHPEAATWPPPEGRNSGYLVVKGADDAAGDDDETCCWGWGTCGESRVRDLPFPQDRVLKVRYTVSNGQTTSVQEEAVVFVPVPDQPLSSNRYYAVIAKGKHKGFVRACSREEDKVTCCFCRCISDVEPLPFDPADVYQQMEIVQRRRGWFTARAVAADGFPSSLYRSKYWEVYASPKTAGKFDLGVLGEATGLDAALRSSQLAADCAFPVAPATAAAAVGKWYSPFFLLREYGVTLPEQMERGAFYEVTLELRWEPAAHAYSGGGGSKLGSMRAYIGGSVEAEEDLSYARWIGDDYVWFKPAAAAAAGQQLGVGVCKSLLERMWWEESRGGWVAEEDAGRKVTGGGSVPVERFVVKRLDGTVAFDFLHLNKEQSSRDF